MKRVYLTRAYHFCAGHRLFDPAREDEWNRRVFGKCSNPGGHGHNYRLEVTVLGRPDRETGWILPVEALDAVVEEEVMARLDHQNLNEQLSRRYGPSPTTEVVVLEIWELLEPKVPPPALLHRLKVAETEKNSFEYFGPHPSGHAPRGPAFSADR